MAYEFVTLTELDNLKAMLSGDAEDLSLVLSILLNLDWERERFKVLILRAYRYQFNKEINLHKQDSSDIRKKKFILHMDFQTALKNTGLDIWES